MAPPKNTRDASVLPLHVLAFLAVGTLLAAAPAPTAAVKEHAASASVHLEALLEFKKGVTADPLGALSGWKKADRRNAIDAAAIVPPRQCNWTGIACDGAGRATSIQLLESQLQGTLTPFLANISTLRLFGPK